MPRVAPIPMHQKSFRFREQCVYCGGPEETRDHVPSKLLLEQPLPPNSLTVPSCLTCNSGYSDDERYVRDALHHVGFGNYSQEKIAPGGVVARSLDHSPLLARKLERAHVGGEDGSILFQPELHRFERIMAKLAVGLWYGRYRGFVGASLFRCEAVEHTRSLSPELLHLTSLQGFARLAWPDVGSRRLHNAAETWLDQQAERRERVWTKVQANVFEYLFVPERSGQAGLFCVINCYDTVRGVVLCPPPPASNRSGQ